MALEIEVNFPDIPKGTEMDVGGLLVKNGEKTSIDEDQELAFVSRNQKALKEKVGENEYIKVTGSPKYGPAAVEKMYPAPSVQAEQEEVEEAEEEEGGES